MYIGLRLALHALLQLDVRVVSLSVSTCGCPGFHVFPKFIINQFAVVMVLTTAVVLVKVSQLVRH